MIWQIIIALWFATDSYDCIRTILAARLNSSLTTLALMLSVAIYGGLAFALHMGGFW